MFTQSAFDIQFFPRYCASEYIKEAEHASRSKLLHKTMTEFFLCFLALLLTINALVVVKIHRNSLYQPMSECAFIRNVSLTGDSSIGSCSWICIDEHDCQTAVFFKNEKTCSMFAELHTAGRLQPSGSICASVIGYRKSHGKSIVCIERSLAFLVRSDRSMPEHCGIDYERRKRINNGDH